MSTLHAVREAVPLTERQMQVMASAWPRYMQVRICICRRTVSSGKHTDDASRPEAAPSPKLCTVLVLQHPDNISAIGLRILHGMSVRPERLHRPTLHGTVILGRLVVCCMMAAACCWKDMAL